MQTTAALFLLVFSFPNIMAQVFHHTTQGSLLRDRGFGFVNFVLHPNSRLNASGSVMLYGPSEKECGKGCTRNSTCFSFNFGMKPIFHNGVEPQYLCELLPTDKYNSSLSYEPSADFHHYSIQTECKNTPCPNNSQCIPNYLTDDYTCLDDDECETKTHHCNSLANCTNTIGSYLCTCLDGLTGDGYECEDIDECAISNGNCHSLAVCNNTIRSFTCQCQAGYSGDGVKICEDIDECLTKCNDKGSQCNNTLGSYTCECLPGYIKESGKCVDKNECSGVNDCHAKANCTNVPGSYSCACIPGFYGDGKSSCNEPIQVTIDSGLELEIHVNGNLHTKNKDGINIIVLNNDGSIDMPIKGFDTLHSTNAASELFYYISSIAKGKIVLMGLHRAGTGNKDHMPDSLAFTQFSAEIKRIGSNVTAHSQIQGKTGWALIGCKDERKPWIAERLDDIPLNAIIIP